MTGRPSSRRRPKGLFLCGEPALQLDGDEGTGEVPLLFIDQTNHRMRMGWYSDTYRRTADGWRLATRTMSFLRRSGDVDSGNPHDPRRPTPDSQGSAVVEALGQDGRPRILVAMRFFWIWAVPPMTLWARL